MKTLLFGLVLAASAIRPADAANLYIGYQENGFEAEVSTANSPLEVATLAVGYGGDSNVLSIVAGGTVNSSAGFVGRGTWPNIPDYLAARANSLFVSGTGSTWNCGTLVVGEGRAFDNRLSIAGGGTVHGSSCTVGRYNFDWNNQLEATGSGSLLSIDNAITVGYRASGASLRIADGAAASSAQGIIGYSDGTIYHANNNTVTVSGSGSRWDISGRLEIGSPVDATNNRLAIAAGGTVAVNGGIDIHGEGNGIHVGDGGRLEIATGFDASHGNFALEAGGALSVAGQLSGFSLLGERSRLEAANLLGDLTVHGTFAPGNSPADCQLLGNLTLAPDGTLEIELGGYLPGAEHDRLAVAGLATLGGTLELAFLHAFSPTNGAVFDLFDWSGGVSGQFATIEASALADGLEWDTSALYSTGTLAVIPEPATGLLMLLAGGLVFFKTRILDQQRRNPMLAGIRRDGHRAAGTEW